ncbi:MAG: phosphatase PAP2 family protein [Campylobacteraceae bacterium]|jgi:membrane-associated phospholipid phosphatase|nr:phosphatase PAP2 family protein [Campylobacteraceae bacterium]
MRLFWFFLSFVAVASFCAFSYRSLDIAVAEYFYTSRPLEQFFEAATKLGESKWYLLGFGAMAVVFRFVFRLRIVSNRFLYLFLAVAGSGLIVDILKFVFGRARPKLYFEEQIYGIKFFGGEYLYYSFPSGHSATAFALGVGALLIFGHRALPVLALAILVVFSRVAITAHYLSDAVAGAYIGALFSVWLAYKMREKGINF